VPSLKLQELLRAARVRAGFALEAKGGSARLAGLTPEAKAFWIAGAATNDPRNDVTMVVVPTDRDVDQIVSDVRFFLGGFEGASSDALEQTLLPFPSQEIDPYRGLAPHLRIASTRARALHALATGQARVVVASATALVPRVSPPEALTALALDLKPGEDIDLHQLAGALVDAGFTRQDPVDEHGEFCIRGGVIDIFPAGDDLPARIELIGDTIEAIHRYAVDTQRSVATIDRLRVLPLRDVVGDAGPRVPFFDYLGIIRRPILVCSEPDEIQARIEKQLAQISESYEQVRGAAAGSGRRHAGSEDLASTRTKTIFVADGLPPPGTIRGAEAPWLRPDTADIQCVPAPDEILVGWPEIQRQLASATTLEELGVDEIAGSAVGDRGAEAPRLRQEDSSASRAFHLACQPVISFSGRLPAWIAEVKAARARNDTVLFVAATPGRAERLIELLQDYELRGVNIDRGEDSFAASVFVTTGLLSRGFSLPAAQLQIYAETDLFEEERRTQERARRSATQTFLSDLRDLKVGDLVVHVDNGIGEFVGLKEMTVGPTETQEFLELRYAGDDKLFVPVSRLDLIQKYAGGARPALDRLGGTTWEKAKTRVKKAMRDMAEELLKLYASRKAVAGHSFASDTHWQEEFEGAFPFDLTVDQNNAIEDIKRDLESSTPMDRLLCGDVGYGKTEVSMRAAFKAVMDAKQVAYLAPTTVLAFQHVKTLRERFAGFPVRIDLLSRFRNKQEQKQTLVDLADGKVDIVVGTHRLLSKDVVFRDLGLLVVDEEQRFGVAHKEKIKQLRKRVDVLTMTATPIPRTLNMSLVGIRDMSIIETPPKDRLAIQTNVVKFDQNVISRAVRNELARGGQVYFVHNRVESISSIGGLLARLVPEAKIVVGHGQMGEHDLERAMIDFMARKFDILLATTIVENGLDIPNVNTIIINRADRYGLSQLYQLRGRVGRSDRPAYAYLLIPPETSLSAVATKRLAAIREFSDLGSGFRVAALDLEIRGAGNLLGGEQSGHIEAIGFEMYMKLLEQAVRELKGEEIEDDVRASVNLGIDIRIDEEYVPDMAQRLVVYRKVAAARSETEVSEVIDEIRDRYGPLPDSVLNLAAYGRIRVMADKLGIESIDRQGGAVVMKFRDSAQKASHAPDPTRMLTTLRRRPDVVLTPPASLRLNLTASHAGSNRLHQGYGVPPKHQAEAENPASTRTVGRPPASPWSPGSQETPTPLWSPGSLDPWSTSPQAARLAKPRRSSTASWWTARATAGTVTTGFTKEEILKPPKEDPRAEGGLFDRVGGLLEDLLR
jgi:transcription-repair coupling factor (superfamily II helicase)